MTHQAFQDPYLQEAREQFLQPNALPIGEAKEKSDGKQFVEIEVYCSHCRSFHAFAPMGQVQLQPGLPCWQWWLGFQQFQPFNVTDL